MKKLRSIVPVALFALMLPVTASAAPFVAYGSLGTDSADWWEVWFGPGGGSIDTEGTPWDTQLFLFQALPGDPSPGPGVGVLGDDDDGSPDDPQAKITGIPGPGHYFVAVTKNDQDPVDLASARIFPNIYTQTGPNGGTGNFGGWVDGSGNLGGYGGALNGLEYKIVFNGVSQAPVHYSAVPEPGTLLLMGTGLAALARRLRRKNTDTPVA